jgi:ATP-dependent Clp protease ATP-binding subunit ClpC
MPACTLSTRTRAAKGDGVPSSKDRQRVEIPTSLYDRLKLLADSEERTLTSLLQDLLRLGLVHYQPVWMPSRFMNRFTPGAQRALSLAREEAQGLHHDYIGTEHLLLGLLREGEGIAAEVLHQLWIEVDQVRQALVYILTHHVPDQPAPVSAAGRRGATPDEPAAFPDAGLTPRARTVLSLAVDEAQRLHQDYVGTEHLLLALAREGEGLAAGILRTFGALGKVREFTLVRMERPDAEESQADQPAS